MRSIIRSVIPIELRKRFFRTKNRFLRSLDKKRILVYSHPRSGTHFLEAFIGENFYKNETLSYKNNTIEWGHWSNRKVNKEGNKYDKLFGSHLLPTQQKVKLPAIYIYRDPKAVAYSVWKTNNFINPKDIGISFSEFLRYKIDWKGTPAIQSSTDYNIIEHWKYHIQEFSKINHKKYLIINYEELKDNPEKVYHKILETFFPLKNWLINNKIIKIPKINPISTPTGLLPNKATKQSWKEVFTESDIDFVNKTLKDFEYYKEYLR